MLTSCNHPSSVTVGYAGEDISRNASIIRDTGNGQVVLELKTDGKWELYAGPSVEKINLEKPVATGTSSGRYLPEIDTTTRNYFNWSPLPGKRFWRKGDCLCRDLTTSGTWVEYGP